MIYSNAVRCRSCATVIISDHRHDYVTCPCGKVSVDGGRDYLKRATRNGGDYEELSDTDERRLEVKGGDAL